MAQTKTRLPEYSPRYCGALLKYFSTDPVTTQKQTIIKKNGDVVEDTLVVANPVPTMAGFAAKIGVWRDVLKAWAKTYPEFDEAVKLAKEYQENMLVSNAMTGHYNTTFSIFAAKNLLGWKNDDDAGLGINQGPFSISVTVVGKTGSEVDDLVKKVNTFSAKKKVSHARKQ